MEDINDDDAVNQKTEQLRIPYSNIVYIGDGLTDVACMILVKNNNGTSIAVSPKEKEAFAKKLKEDGRVNYAVNADYRKGSDLETAVKLAIDKVKLNADIDLLGGKNDAQHK